MAVSHAGWLEFHVQRSYVSGYQFLRRSTVGKAVVLVPCLVGFLGATGWLLCDTGD